MFKNYLTIAMRNLIKYKGYSLINILGLAVGMACSILIIMYIRYESNYDHFYTNAGCIYRVVDGTNARTGAELGPHMLYTINADKPGFIGRLGSILGAAGVNIATFHLGRGEAGGDADREEQAEVREDRIPGRADEGDVQ